MSSKTKAIKKPNESKIFSDTANSNFPIIAIGASAGGLAAFENFFSGLPLDTLPNMAFVLIQHLAPDRPSLLSQLLTHYCHLPVFEIINEMRIENNCIYIIPPDFDISIQNGHLYLKQPIAARGHRHPIDFFFKSLAQQQHENAIGIILSGSGHDGCEGARVIKEEGGLLLAQTIESAEFRDMPASLIATGLTDYVLAPKDMFPKLLETIENKKTHPANPTLIKPSLTSVDALKKIVGLLQSETQHDFSLYKPNTIYRRIERRMLVLNQHTIAEYTHFLEHNPSEIQHLFNDLLIGVTQFFRDETAFKTLEQEIIPSLFKDKSANNVVRVWTPGCSTGQEPYSIAILLQDYLDKQHLKTKVQIFATDIDPVALNKARAGLYPLSISSDLSAQHLEKFFTLEPDGKSYRISKCIRDKVIFSEHNVIKDPPFSKLDLISCRNLLIYMTADLQNQLIPLFHYALKPNGILFLGSSETIGEFDSLFQTLHRHTKLYCSKKRPHINQLKHIGSYLKSNDTSLFNRIQVDQDKNSQLFGNKTSATLLTQSLHNPLMTLDDNTEITTRVTALHNALKLKDDYMQAIQEELETTNAELRCSIEELQSVNEELQSTNEELETSKEEAQCINEELNIVNTELETRLNELSKANNDMNNLLAGTGIATLFLDTKLNILRFTPTACQVINLIPSDVGRPVNHLALNLLNYQHLTTDISAVLIDLVPKTIEICTVQHKWLRMCIQPYRTLNNVIEGIVITFIDINEIIELRKLVNNLQNPKPTNRPSPHSLT
ncbi:MAG: PAS domain-containing protein [Methylococcales bacterium]|nr:PAS domain-containing protein [Methylococcales bacterium]